VEVLDISLPVSGSMTAWPTGRPVAVQRVVDEGGDAPRNSEWTLDSHAGTHVDAPLHWLPGGASVDSIPLEACLGECTVVSAGRSGMVLADDVPEAVLRRGHRVLFRTPNSDSRLGADAFDPDFVALSPEVAQRLVDGGVALVGLDYLGVERPGSDGSVHRTLLGAGVVILEGIDLRRVEPGEYQLGALPIPLAGGEASPVRAVLWK
jgi:arylformamidase